MGKVIEITDENFEVEVTQSAVPVLLDFLGDHCGPCKMLKPVLIALAEEMGDTIKVGTVDVADNERLTNAFKIEVVPTIIVMKNGKVAQRLIGLQSKRQLQAALEA